MTKITITLLVSLFALSAQANDALFAACEQVSEMAVLAKDNIPYWTNNRNTNVESCYSDIKEFISAATSEDIAQFNSEFEGQIVICTTDTDFAHYVTEKKSDEQKFIIPISSQNSLTPVIKPSVTPKFFSK
jgi:hypothetical protein